MAGSALFRSVLIVTLLSSMVLSGEGVRVSPFPPLGSDHDVSLDNEPGTQWMVQAEEHGTRHSMESTARRSNHASKKGVSAISLPMGIVEVVSSSRSALVVIPQQSFPEDNSLSPVLSDRAPPAV